MRIGPLRSATAALLGTVAVGFVCEMMKLAVNRLRPPPVDQVASPEVAMSFLSGHVTSTATTVFGVAELATVGSRQVRRIAAIIAATMVAAHALTAIESHTPPRWRRVLTSRSLTSTKG